MTELTRCPPYADLLAFADRGDPAQLDGHAPAQCPRCSERLAEYATVREALQGLAGIELFSPEALNAAWDEAAPDAGEIAPVRELLAFTRDPGCGATALADARRLIAQARGDFYRDWPSAARLAAAARQAAFSPSGDSRMVRALARSLQAEATGVLGHCLVSSGKFEEGLALLLDAHHRWTALGDPLGLGNNLINLAVAYMYKKRLKTAEGCARQAIAVLGAISQEAEVAAARQALAIVLGDLGERDEALRESQHAAGAFRKLGRTLALGHTLHTVAGHLFALRRDDEALATIIEASRLVEAQEDRLSAARCDWTQGQIECGRPASFAVGIARIERAAQALIALDQWLETVCLLCDKVALELGAGLHEEARRDFAVLLARLPADRVNPWVSEALLGLHRLFEQAETEALIRALGEFNRRLQSGEAPVQTEGSETSH